MMRVARQRNFALLWTAGLVSLFGDWAFYIIMPVFVLDETGSVFLSGVVWAVIALPSVFVGPVAGVYVDRWDRRRIMLWGNLAQAVAAAILAITGSAPGIWLSMTLLLVNASLASIILPAENALLPTLVPDDDLATANSLNSMNDNLGRILGPAAGAVIYAAIGIQGVATLNAASFLLAAALIRLVDPDLRSPSVPAALPPRRPTAPFWPSLCAGARIVRHHRLLYALVLVLGLIAFADGPLAAIIPAFVDTTLGKGAEGVGAFSVFRGLAGILGGVVIAYLAPRVRETSLLVASAAGIGLGFASMAIVQNFTVACVVLVVVIGTSHIGLHTTLATMLQRASEDAYRGRVFTLTGAVTGALFLIGTLAGSAAAALSSPTAVILTSGLLFLLTALVILLLLPTAHSSHRQPAHSTDVTSAPALPRER